MVEEGKELGNLSRIAVTVFCKFDIVQATR
jgi:hypothetical protein